MNEYNVPTLIYKIQDLVIQKGLTNLKKFKNEIFKICMFENKEKKYKFTNDQIEKIFAFTKTIQHHPKSVLLIHALKPMLKMFFESLIIDEFVVVYNEKWNKHLKIKYHELHISFVRKGIKQEKCNYFILPFKAKVPSLATLAKKANKQREEMEKAAYQDLEWKQICQRQRDAYILSVGIKAYEEEQAQKKLEYNERLEIIEAECITFKAAQDALFH